MKKSSIVTLLLAGALAVPAFAQHSSSTDQTAPQATSQPATKADSATGKEPLQPDSKEGFWGKLNPFARKKYVQRQTDPIRDRVNELDELTSANSKMISGCACRISSAAVPLAASSTRYPSSRKIPQVCALTSMSSSTARIVSSPRPLAILGAGSAAAAASFECRRGR